MSRNTSVLTRFILDTAFGLPGIILFGLLSGIAVGLTVGRSVFMGASLPENPTSDASLVAGPGGLDGPTLAQFPTAVGRRNPGTVSLQPALAIDYGQGTTLLVRPPVPPVTRPGVADSTSIAKAGSCAVARSPIDHN